MQPPARPPGQPPPEAESGKALIVIELIAGPFDGMLIEVDEPPRLPLGLIVRSHREEPVYLKSKNRVLRSDTNGLITLPYVFVGYEQNLRYEYPEQFQSIKAINKKSRSLQDPEK